MPKKDANAVRPTFDATWLVPFLLPGLERDLVASLSLGLQSLPDPAPSDGLWLRQTALAIARREGATEAVERLSREWLDAPQLGLDEACTAAMVVPAAWQRLSARCAHTDRISRSLILCSALEGALCDPQALAVDELWDGVPDPDSIKPVFKTVVPIFPADMQASMAWSRFEKAWVCAKVAYGDLDAAWSYVASRSSSGPFPPEIQFWMILAEACRTEARRREALAAVGKMGLRASESGAHWIGLAIHLCAFFRVHDRGVIARVVGRARELSESVRGTRLGASALAHEAIIASEEGDALRGERLLRQAVELVRALGPGTAPLDGVLEAAACLADTETLAEFLPGFPSLGRVLYAIALKKGSREAERILKQLPDQARRDAASVAGRCALENAVQAGVA